MGSILGTSLSDTQESLLVKIVKYNRKVQQMINEYKAAKDIAIANYKAYGFTAARVDNYTNAWNTMPADYEAKMKDVQARIKKWISKYVFKMFGVKLTDSEVNSAVSKILSMV